MDPVTPTALDNLLTVVSSVWDGISSVVTTISGNALLLIPLAGAFASLTIGLCMKLMGIRRKRR